MFTTLRVADDNLTIEDRSAYCPETIADVGGLGIYDGPTNPGFQALKAELWNAMEADGYDIVDAKGNVNIADPGAGGGGVPSCLEATPDDGLTLTFTIPAVPSRLTTPVTIATVENIGLSLAGVPITSGLPTDLDGCGGHTASTPSSKQS